jgi:hypothetical protein
MDVRGGMVRDNLERFLFGYGGMVRDNLERFLFGYASMLDACI